MGGGEIEIERRKEVTRGLGREDGREADKVRSSGGVHLKGMRDEGAEPPSQILFFFFL